MPIRYQEWISCNEVQKNQAYVYVFGDNTERDGYGGQARAMRGEPNSVGVATKRKPTMEPDAFFSDDDWRDRMVLEGDLRIIKTILIMGKTVIVPSDGLGTGLSKLPEKAPKLYATLLEFFRENSDDEHPCPWPAS